MRFQSFGDGWNFFSRLYKRMDRIQQSKTKDETYSYEHNNHHKSDNDCKDNNNYYNDKHDNNQKIH